MLLDPSTTIIKAHGKYAGPLAEIEVCLVQYREEKKIVNGKKKKKRMSPQGGSNSRPLVYETSALPLSYRGNHEGVGGDFTYLSGVYE